MFTIHASRDPQAMKLRDFRRGVIDQKCSRRCAFALKIARHERLKDLRRHHALDLVEVEKVIVEPGRGIHSLARVDYQYWHVDYWLGLPEG